MDLIVKTEALVRELALLQRAVSRRPTLPALGGVLLEASGDRVGCATTDLEIAMRATVPADVADKGSALAPAQKLYDLVRTLADEDVRLTSSGANIAARGRTFSARLQAHPLEDFPTVPAAPGAGIALRRPVLLDLIRRVRFAVTEDDKRYYLGGAQLEVREDRVRLVATDAHRLAVADAPPAGATHAPVLLPRKTLDAVAAALEESEAADVTFAASENHVFFVAGSRVIVSRTIDGKFPAYERIIPAQLAHAAEVPRQDLERALRRSAMVADAATRRVEFTLSPQGFRLAARSAEVGDADEQVTATYGGPEVRFALNVGYVLDFLDAAGGASVAVEAAGPDRAVTWRGVGGDVAYTYVTMPVTA